MKHQNELGFRIGILSNLIHRRIDQAIHSVQENPCTGMQGHIMGYLYRNRGRDVFQRDLQEWLSVRRSTVTGLLQLMEKRGLITRESVAQDARLKKIALTPLGIRMHEEVGQVIHQVEDSIRDILSPEERETFLHLCEKLQAALESPENPKKTERSVDPS